MSKKDINIESYDGQDAFYAGTDEEYEQFLKNADVRMNIGEDAEPVANTQRINLNETINIQGVIDKFRKTAGEIESGAKKIKDSVVSRMDSLKAKKEAEAEETTANSDGYGLIQLNRQALPIKANSRVRFEISRLKSSW